MQITEDMRQKAEWRARLAVAIAGRLYDDNTLVAMLHAGFEEAFSEGMLEAAALCSMLSHCEEVSQPKRHALSVAANAIRELDAKNRAGNTEFSLGQPASPAKDPPA